MLTPVSLRNLAGDELELMVWSDSPGSDLKSTIAARWNIPVRCQKLIIGAEVLSDSVPLASQFQTWSAANSGAAEARVPVTVLVSLDDVNQGLESADVGRQIDALQALESLAPGACEAETSVLPTLELLRSPHWHVRAAAVEALAKVCERGDLCAVSTLAKCLGDEKRAVARAAAAAIKKVARMGDTQAIAAVVVKLAHQHARVRRAALEALPHVAHEGAQETVAAILPYLAPEAAAGTKRAALEALRALGGHQCGEEHSVASICVCLEDTDEWVRREAAELLELCASWGKACVVAGLIRRTSHSDPDVRILALTTLAKVASVGDAGVIAAVGGCLEDVFPEVRSAAIESLLAVSERGDEHAILVATTASRHAHPGVRRAAAEALQKVRT